MRVGGQEILEPVEAGTCVRKDFGKRGVDETQERVARLVADSDVVEAEQVLPHGAASQILVGSVIALVDRLMEDDPTHLEDFDGDPREAASDEDGNAVQRNALEEKLLNVATTGVDPLPDVLGFDTCGALALERNTLVVRARGVIEPGPNARRTRTSFFKTVNTRPTSFGVSKPRIRRSNTWATGTRIT